MKKEEIQLTYYQIMIFIYKIEEIKKQQPEFSDEKILKFEDNALKRAQEILKLSQIKLKLKPSLGRYPISVDLFNYLEQITGLNPLDKETYDNYVPIIKELENQLLENPNTILKKR